MGLQAKDLCLQEGWEGMQVRARPVLDLVRFLKILAPLDLGVGGLGLCPVGLGSVAHGV